MFITFEGIEGSGKSTALRNLAEHLTKKNFSVCHTREPGGSHLGRTLRSVLLDARTQDLSSRAELFLFLADRAQHVHEVIAPALEAGEIVLCDRYMDSTFVYQGAGRGLDIDQLKNLNASAIGSFAPDLTLLFDLPVETGLSRAGKRNEDEQTSVSEGRFEAESLAFHSRVREGYHALQAQEPERIVFIDASQSPEDVLLQCISVVEQKLYQLGRLSD